MIGKIAYLTSSILSYYYNIIIIPIISLLLKIDQEVLTSRMARLGIPLWNWFDTHAEVLERTLIVTEITFAASIMRFKLGSVEVFFRMIAFIRSNTSTCST